MKALPTRKQLSEMTRRDLDPNGDGVCPHCQQTLPYLDDYVPHKLDFVMGAAVALIPALLVYATGFSSTVAMIVYLLAAYWATEHFVHKGREEFRRNRERQRHARD